MPIHFDTLVFLSVPLWHIHRMRTYWLSRGQEMSLFLAQEMLFGFFKSNNPLRYHRFAGAWEDFASAASDSQSGQLLVSVCLFLENNNLSS
jgi:hypothetical protein